MFVNRDVGENSLEYSHVQRCEAEVGGLERRQKVHLGKEKEGDGSAREKS